MNFGASGNASVLHERLSHSRNLSSVTNPSLPWLPYSTGQSAGELTEELGLTLLFIAHDLSMVHISSHGGGI